jgi:tetratricopeptide (TPR) repeat protein
MQVHFRTHDELESAARRAEEAWRRGQWREAIRLYCSMFLARWHDLGGRSSALTPADLTILERITDLAVPLGMIDEADDTLRQVAEGYRRIGDRCWHDRILLKRVHLALNESRIDQALAQIGALCGSGDPSIQCLTDWQATYPHGHISRDVEELFAQAWLEAGRLLHAQGCNRPALLCFDRGLRHHAASVPCQVHLRLAVVRCLLELGELQACAERLTTLRASLDPVRYPGHLTAWHELSGKLHLLQGNFGPALQDLRAVWDVCRDFAFVAPMIRAATNLAQTQVLMNQTIEAVSVLEQVVAIASDQGEQRLLAQAQRLLDVAQARFRDASERAASVKDEQAATVRVETPDPILFQPAQVECYTLSHFEDRALRVQLHLRRHDWASARKALDRLEPFMSTDSRIVHARFQALRAMLDYHDGDLATAKASLSSARQMLLELGLQPERWQVQQLLTRCLGKLDESSPERNALGEENDRLLESFGASLPVADRVTYLLDKATELDEALARRVRRVQHLLWKISTSNVFVGVALRVAVWREINALLDAAYWQREAHNARLLDRPAEAVSPRRATPLLRRLLFVLPAEATLAFLVFPDSTVQICRRWMSLSLRVSSVSRTEVRQRIGDWHRLIPKANPEERNAVMRSLGVRLGLDEMARSLPWYVRRLRILPDDSLHGLPFAAIELSTNGRRPTYWGERFSISIGFQPEKRPHLRRTHTGDRPLVIGVMGGTQGLPSLVRTPHQLGWLREWLEGRRARATVLLDEEATVESVCHRLPTATLFHASCHGNFVQGEPARTGLVLAGPAGHETLDLLRMSGLDLTNLSHATLIACWGADNFIMPGRWILSLPEALWRAGASSVLASLWEVDEDLAERFVKIFYEQLIHHPPDAALKKTQARLRTEAGKGRDAKDWASFQIYGDPRRVRI